MSSQRPLQDPEYLRSVTYRNATRLNARIEFWIRYGASRDESFTRFFELMGTQAESTILELGCGRGDLWQWGVETGRVSPGWGVTLTYLSDGMLDEARRRLEPADHSFRFQVVDAADIPYPDASSDVVVANYMLYHLADVDLAVDEIFRVLKPGGRLVASTNSGQHIAEIIALQRRFALDKFSAANIQPTQSTFTLEAAPSILSRKFPNVSVHPDHAIAKVDDAEMLVNYIASMNSESDIKQLRSHLIAEIAANGYIPVTRSTGVLVAT